MKSLYNLMLLALLILLTGCAYDKGFMYNRTKNDNRTGYTTSAYTESYEEDENTFLDEDYPDRSDKKESGNTDNDTSSKPSKHLKPQYLNNNSESKPSKHAKPDL